VRVSGGAAGYAQRVVGNAVFSDAPLSGGQQAANVWNVYSAAGSHLRDPWGAVGSTLDLRPLPGALQGGAISATGLTGFLDWDRDFGGGAYNLAFRGAYSGQGTNPGWTPALGQKPEIGSRRDPLVVASGGAWHHFNFATGAYDAASSVWTGTAAGCIPALMDYDGDGRREPTQFCGGAWHFYEENGAYRKGCWTGGRPGDRPVPADYNGDGRDDVVVFSGGAWQFFSFDTCAYSPGSSVWTGAAGSNAIPLPMDYDGDGSSDFTIHSGGAWHFFNDNGSYRKGIWTGGQASDVPAPGDYDGNGTEDVVIFSSGAWHHFSFATGAYDAARSVWTGASPWNGVNPLPAPLDHDGNGALDYTVYCGGPWHFFNHDGAYNRGLWTGGLADGRALSRRMLP
jgi:hypothetical protein